MQVYLPLNTPGVTYEDTRAFSRGLAQVLARRMPDLVVSDMDKAKRAGKVFVDWSQNDRHKTTVNVYSLRAMEQPTVSTPLTWDEVSRTSRSRWPSRRRRCWSGCSGWVICSRRSRRWSRNCPGSYAGTRAPGPAWARTSLAPSLAPHVVHVRWASSVPPQSRWVSTTGGPSGA